MPVDNIPAPLSLSTHSPVFTVKQLGPLALTALGIVIQAEEQKWQPMASFPRDGRSVEVLTVEGVKYAAYVRRSARVEVGDLHYGGPLLAWRTKLS